MADQTWTEPEIETLKTMCVDGLSYREIADVVGHSKNACIGKARRMGITNGRPHGSGLTIDQSVKAARRRERRRKPPAPLPEPRPLPVSTSIEVAPTDDAHEPEAAQAAPEPVGDGTVLIMELRDHHCRYPFGDRAPFRFCGCKPREGEPWCAKHRKVCIDQTRARRE